MIALRLLGYYLDLDPRTSFNLKLSNPIFDRESIERAFSEPFTIQLTETNMAALKHANRLDVKIGKKIEGVNLFLGGTWFENSVVLCAISICPSPYPIPASWTLDGFSAGFNSILSELDKSFIASVYQKTTDVDEPSVYNNTYDTLKFMFQTKKELNTLSERYIVRAGLLLSLPVNINKRKSENLDIVAKHLKLV